MRNASFQADSKVIDYDLKNKNKNKNAFLRKISHIITKTLLKNQDF